MAEGPIAPKVQAMAEGPTAPFSDAWYELDWELVGSVGAMSQPEADQPWQPGQECDVDGHAAPAGETGHQPAEPRGFILVRETILMPHELSYSLYGPNGDFITDNPDVSDGARFGKVLDCRDPQAIELARAHRERRSLQNLSLIHI